MADAPDLHDLSYLLGQCLGRIDEEAFRLIAGDEDIDPEAAAVVLEDEASRLQNLVASILSTSHRRERDLADLNRIVEASVHSMLQELPVPVVIRQRLHRDLPPVQCAPGQLSYAIQRALVLATSHADSGSEILLSTRLEDDEVLFELACPPGSGDKHMRDRALTLRAFVAGFHGRCDVEVDPAGTLLLAMALPIALELDQN